MMDGETLKHVSVWLLALMFVGAGAMHFVRPAAFEAIVPPWLPSPRTLVLVSGAAEVVGGIGLLLGQTRDAAGIGLIVLLLAVLPANVFMVQESARFAALAPKWLLVARVPLQFLLIGWVFWASRP